MNNKVNIGGDRLGSGAKNDISLKNYERSTHDLSYLWRSTLSSGTLVPFLNEVALPGDNFEIDLNAIVMTNPTIGPLFGSYKVQLDVFQIPMRLYNGNLHMNALNIGLKMSQIKLPQIKVKGKGLNVTDNSQINPSSLLAHLNIRGLGRSNAGATTVSREFNAIPYLAYWDIYKQYYANKQEEIGMCIHANASVFENIITSMRCFKEDNTQSGNEILEYDNGGNNLQNDAVKMVVLFQDEEYIDADDISIYITNNVNQPYRLTQLFNNIENLSDTYEKVIICSDPTNLALGIGFDALINIYGYKNNAFSVETEAPRIKKFPLENIDKIKKLILQSTDDNSVFKIDENSLSPYRYSVTEGQDGKFSSEFKQENLALKTYQSDIFNNWISTEWIVGNNGINELTAVNTSDGSFTIDSLNLANKMYDMLNRIAISGGTYDDWLGAVYAHDRVKSVENAIYLGGLSKELGFEEVISNAESSDNNGNTQPLGTLAGRGVMTKKEKGGRIEVRVDEPSYIMGIISLTPRIDYSQGNKWDVNLKTMDDLHKPALDEIGYQDLLTDQMATWDTEIDGNGQVIFKSAGKVPAWINYMTNTNVVRGNFAEENEQMFMVLNRRYEKNEEGNIKDLTTYVDPSKFNNIFADERLDAMNFWTQISVDMKVRRKISARMMPNL